jgi:pyruvate dehydrogenase E1 component alpha subunit
MASLWKLPVLYVIENNKYALGTSINRSVAGKDLTTRGDPFGIPTIQIDGMDLLDVVEKSKKAIEKVRNGKGPTILHIDTYRYKGHSMSDPATYRSREEVNDVRNTRDPLVKIRQTFEDIDYDKIEKEISQIIDESEKFAIESNLPEPEQLYCNILV